MIKEDLLSAVPVGSTESVPQGHSESVGHTLHCPDQGQQSLLKDCPKKT